MTPVKRSSKARIPERRDVLLNPFPFMSGRQVLFNCAREALFYGIRLLGDLPAKIHVPAYCCRSVLLPLERLKIEIKFYDTGEHLEPVLDKSELSDNDIFLLIHYFGIPQNTSYINRLCRENNMVLAEDCAHVLPDPGGGHIIGSSGSFSIYSLRKHLPVPDGGVLVVNDLHLKENADNLLSTMVTKISKKKWLVTNLERLAFSLGWPNTLFLKDVLRKVFGSTDSVFSDRMFRECVPQVSHVTTMVLGRTDFSAVAEVRRKNYRYLSEHVSDIHEITIPFSDLPDGVVPQAFPILVEDVDSVCAFMRKRGIGAGRWPGPEIPECISWDDFPGSLRWVNKLILLPIHQDLDLIHLERIVSIFKEAL